MRPGSAMAKLRESLELAHETKEKQVEKFEEVKQELEQENQQRKVQQKVQEVVRQLEQEVLRRAEVEAKKDKFQQEVEGLKEKLTTKDETIKNLKTNDLKKDAELTSANDVPCALKHQGQEQEADQKNRIEELSEASQEMGKLREEAGGGVAGSGAGEGAGG